MADVLRFWLRRGVDGFRVDANAVLAEDALLRDDPPNPEAGDDTPPPERLQRVFTDGRPETLGYLADLRAVVDALGPRPDGRVHRGPALAADRRRHRRMQRRHPTQ